MSNEEAEKYKAQGNEATKNKNWDEAIKLYNKAITLDPNNAVYLSNRSAVWASKGKYDSALSDAEKCLNADPNFVKGHSRKGTAYIGLGKMAEAKKAFEAGLAADAGNAGCKQGLQDLEAAKRRRAAQAAASGGGGLGGMFGGTAGGIIGTIKEKMKGMGRMQMYMVLMVGYFGFTKLTGMGKSSSKSPSSSPAAAGDQGDDAYGDEPAKLVRSFADLDGRWVSYLHQQGAEADAATLLLLHGTSRSAEGEFGDALPKLLPHAKRIVAPDRPCHGYSPCPEGGEGGDTSWLRTLLDKRGGGGGLWLAAAGREAARQALALARSRPEVSQVWLMSPHVSAPGFPADVSQADAVRSWLAERSGGGAGVAVADAARWAVASGKGREGKAAPSGALNVAKIPARVKVTVLYAADEEEDADLKKGLETHKVAFEVRHGAASESLLDLLADEARQRAEPAVDHGDPEDAEAEASEHEEA